jgi:hypothetical protein
MIVLYVYKLLGLISPVQKANRKNCFWFWSGGRNEKINFHSIATTREKQNKQQKDKDVHKDHCRDQSITTSSIIFKLLINYNCIL